MKSIKDLAKEALEVQDACNLSGVVHSFSRAITELRELLREHEGYGTHMVNTHPVCVAYASKIASLSGADDFGPTHEAFAILHTMVQS